MLRLSDERPSLQEGTGTSGLLSVLPTKWVGRNLSVIWLNRELFKLTAVVIRFNLADAPWLSGSHLQRLSVVCAQHQ